MQVTRFSDADRQTEKEIIIFQNSVPRLLLRGRETPPQSSLINNKNRLLSHYPLMWTWTENTTAMVISTEGTVKFTVCSSASELGVLEITDRKQSPKREKRSLKHLTSVSPVFLVNFKSAKFSCILHHNHYYEIVLFLYNNEKPHHKQPLVPPVPTNYPSEFQKKKKKKIH